MLYYMLNPKDITDCKGIVSDDVVMHELNVTFGQFKNIVNCQYPYYKDSILVEVAPDAKRDDPNEKFDEVLVYTSKRGSRYYVCRDCTVKVIDRNKKTRQLKTWKHHNVHVCKFGDKEVNVGRIIAKAFLKSDLSRNDVVIIDGDLKLENIQVWDRKKWLSHVALMASANKMRNIGYYENGKLVKVYSSSREVSKELYCSYQTILDKCNGIYKNSVVDVRWLDE